MSPAEKSTEERREDARLVRDNIRMEIFHVTNGKAVRDRRIEYVTVKDTAGYIELKTRTKIQTKVEAPTG